MDGHVLWLNITQDEAKRNYERDKTPETSTYYMEEHPRYSSLSAPDFTFPSPLPLIPMKLSKSEKEIEVPEGDISRVYACPLCNEIFQTEEELGNHVEKADH